MIIVTRDALYDLGFFLTRDEEWHWGDHCETALLWWGGWVMKDLSNYWFPSLYLTDGNLTTFIYIVVQTTENLPNDEIYYFYYYLLFGRFHIVVQTTSFTATRTVAVAVVTRAKFLSVVQLSVNTTGTHLSLIPQTPFHEILYLIFVEHFMKYTWVVLFMS